MKKIAVLTSGGDAPGMNAAIHAVVKRGTHRGIEVIGVKDGYTGLLDGNFLRMDLNDVEDIIQRGGTILRSSRSEWFKTHDGQFQAVKRLKEKGVDGLIVIGGDGTFKGADKLTELGIATIGIPATIDNDISGTEYTIGFDTAVNTVVNSIDKIKDTANSISRIFVIEVMGRDAGDIAVWSAVCTDADSIIIPETPYNLDHIVNRIKSNNQLEKAHSIIIVAEGVCSGEEIKARINERSNLEIRVLVLGYLQRGGSPTAYDRMMASKMGIKAIDLLLNLKKGVMVSWKNGQLCEIPFKKAKLEKHMIEVPEYYSI